MRNTLLHYKIIGAPKKIQNGPVLCLGWPRTNHTRNQKSNPSRETVPFDRQIHSSLRVALSKRVLQSHLMRLRRQILG
jgi:hypothetical protein